MRKRKNIPALVVVLAIAFLVIVRFALLPSLPTFKNSAPAANREVFRKNIKNSFSSLLSEQIGSNSPVTIFTYKNYYYIYVLKLSTDSLKQLFFFKRSAHSPENLEFEKTPYGFDGIVFPPPWSRFWLSKKMPASIGSIHFDVDADSMREDVNDSTAYYSLTYRYIGARSPENRQNLLILATKKGYSLDGNMAVMLRHKQVYFVLMTPRNSLKFLPGDALANLIE